MLSRTNSLINPFPQHPGAAMKPPLFVRSLSDQEREALRARCRERSSFTLRRCQIILASADRQKVSQIARHLHCARQTVRNAIHAFCARGLASLKLMSSRPKTVQPLFDGRCTIKG